ncbi:ABC transporter ATP-binding protein, putative [Babesia bigemina]|uniref:ABC transporter ATP-binding protein, putative n=1 Tax=Babesia bigemina TaxID=5866 RepID=A0A061D0S5_BABBI|nr:ABC transporter ATP-binding protein, putative [Babesia bigemina]CDR94243.1 ABC transporter ATP-binding protein, putative [Babesia bigemina]|eukprot:XP_012766429.1 ABC transporter ATP-binding protein, putative [Babesia bigemina]
MLFSTLTYLLFALVYYIVSCASLFNVKTACAYLSKIRHYKATASLNRRNVPAYSSSWLPTISCHLGSVFPSRYEHGVSATHESQRQSLELTKSERKLSYRPIFEKSVSTHFGCSKERAPLLDVSDLTLCIGDCVLFDNVRFRISQGECVGIVGNNGTGKSSLLDALYEKITGCNTTSEAVSSSVGVKITSKEQIHFASDHLQVYQLLYFLRIRKHNLDDLSHLRIDELLKSDDYMEFLDGQNIFTSNAYFNNFVAYVQQNYVTNLDDSMLVKDVIANSNTIHKTLLAIFRDIEKNLSSLSDIAGRMDIGSAAALQGSRQGNGELNIEWARRILTVYNNDNMAFQKKSGDVNVVASHLIDMFGMREVLSLRVGELSGGFKMRLALLTRLIHDPQLLLLDEPTNNLDIASVTFLSKVLRHLIETRGLSVIIVSHNASFLRSLCTSILQVPGDGTLKVHECDFDRFLHRGSKNLQSRMSRLNKLQSDCKKLKQQYNAKLECNKGSKNQKKVWLSQKRRLIDDTEELLRKVTGAEKSTYSDAYERSLLLHDSHFDAADLLRLPLVKRGTFVYPDKPAFSLQDATLRSGSEALLCNISLQVHNCDRVLILGNNGSGKSTLLTVLNAAANAATMGIPNVNELLNRRSYVHVADGRCEAKENTSVNYLSQNCSDILTAASTVGTLAMNYGDMDMSNRQQLTEYMSHFYLKDLMDIRVRDLSFGERCRLALALQFLRDSNFLLLDEPSNHLDLYMKRNLVLLLNNVYTRGGIILATHDLQLLERLERITTIFYIHQFDKTYTFKGDFKDTYLRFRREVPDASHTEMGNFLESCTYDYKHEVTPRMFDFDRSAGNDAVPCHPCKRLKRAVVMPQKRSKTKLKNAKRYT